MMQANNSTKNRCLRQKLLKFSKMNNLLTVYTKEAIYNYLRNKADGYAVDKREIGFSDIFRFLNIIKGGTYKEIDILNELIEAYRENDDVRMSAEEKRIFTSGTKREAIKALLANGQITGFVFEGVEFISDDDHSSTGSR